MLWDLERGVWRYRIEPHQGSPVVNMDCDPRTGRILSVGGDGSIALSTTKTSEVLCVLQPKERQHVDMMSVSIAGPYMVCRNMISLCFYYFTLLCLY